MLSIFDFKSAHPMIIYQLRGLGSRDLHDRDRLLGCKPDVIYFYMVALMSRAPEVDMYWVAFFAIVNTTLCLQFSSRTGQHAF